jgi:hypothetical protein
MPASALVHQPAYCYQPITHLVPLMPTCRPLRPGVQAPEAGWRLLRLNPV